MLEEISSTEKETSRKNKNNNKLIKRWKKVHYKKILLKYKPNRLEQDLKIIIDPAWTRLSQKGVGFLRK